MCAPVFADTLSSSCSNFAFKKTAVDNEKKFREMATATLKNNFYLYDLLKFVVNADKESKLI